MAMNGIGIWTYLKEFGIVDSLTAQQNLDLAYVMKGFGEKVSDAVYCSLNPKVAEDRMMRGNLALVGNIASELMKKYSETELDLELLLAEGERGLHRAIQKYDPFKINKETGRPYAFSTYATNWIKSFIERSLESDAEGIRVSSNIRDIIPRWIHAYTELKESTGYDPFPEEVFNKVNQKIDAEAKEKEQRKRDGKKTRGLRSVKIKKSQMPLILRALEVMGVNQGVVYLDRLEEPGDMVCDPRYEDPAERAFVSECAENMDRILSSATERERHVLTKRYGLDGADPLTLEQAGKGIGAIKESVRNIEKEAIGKLQRAVKRGELIPRNGQQVPATENSQDGVQSKKPVKRRVNRVITYLRLMDENERSIMLTDYDPMLTREAV